jgi:hypothetical protein
MTAAVRKNVASSEQVEAAEHFEQSMITLKGALAAIGRQVIVSIMPALLAMSDGLAKISIWVRENSTIVKAVLLGIAAAFLLIGVNALIMGAQAAIAWIMALGPIELIIIAITALVAGISWVYLEFQKWASGGQSVLGKFFQFFKDAWDSVRVYVLTVFNTLKEIFMTYVAVIMDQWDLIVGIFTFNGEKIKTAFKKLCTDLGHLFSQVALLIVYELLHAFFMLEKSGAAMWQHFKEAAMDAFAFINKKMATIGNFIIKVMSLGQYGGQDQYHFEGGHAGMAVRPGVSNSSSTSTSSRETHIGKIEVVTQATDAKGIAAELPGALRSQGLVDQVDGAF